MSRKTVWPLLLVAAVVVVGVGVVYRGGQAGPVLSEPMVTIHRAQQRLPADEVAAIQALRVVSAVEAVYLAEHGHYATPAALKAAGVLDPEWPRLGAGLYKVHCQVIPKWTGFACYADPTASTGRRYFVDPSQVVRYEKNSQPYENSPVFGLSKEMK